MIKILLFLLLSFTLNGQYIHKLEVDDYAHLGAGYAISSAVSVAASHHKIKRPLLVGFGTAVVAAGAKELYDYHCGGTPEFQDFWMSFIGAGLGCVVINISLSDNKVRYGRF
jgi:hypothetical protein